MSEVTTTFTLTITSPPAVGVPAWFTAAPELTWIPLANGSGSGAAGGSTLTQKILAADYVWPTDPADPLTPLTPTLGPQGAIMKPAAYCQNSNGMAVDATRGYCYIVSNGGHGGYMGNETMALDLRAETPGWVRFIDSTPPWHVASVANGAGFDSAEEDVQGTWSYICFTDGPAWSTDFTAFPTYGFPKSAITRRTPATHTSCLPTFSEGKVWLPLQNSTNMNGGRSTFTKLSCNVDEVHADGTKKLWKYGDIRPWEFHGIMNDVASLQAGSSQSNFLFPTAALDPATGRIWVCPGTSNSMRYFWMLETRGANAGKHQTFQTPNLFYLRTDNAVSGDITTGVLDAAGNPITLFVLYGRRLQARDVFVLNVTAINTAFDALPAAQKYTGVIGSAAWAKYTATDAVPMRWINADQFAQGKDPNGTWGPQQGWGMVWHQPSKAFLLFNCDQAVDINRARNGKLRKLALPVDGSGRYNPAGAWQYSEVAIAGPIPDPLLPAASGNDSLVRGGSFSRFNIMRNFDGAGHDLLVSVNADDKPISVIKLPTTGV